MSDEIKKLNFGSGEDKKEGYVNVDWNDLTVPDVKHDLNKMPYPFPDNRFELIEAIHILEHLERPFDVMKEFYRILKPEGKLIIKVPHFSRGFTHAEHSHGFDVTFPLYFNKKFSQSGFSGYYGVDFEIENVKLQWMAFIHILPVMGYGQGVISFLKILNKTFSFLANLSPHFCSRVWCFWVGGFEEIEFTLIVKK